MDWLKEQAQQVLPWCLSPIKTWSPFLSLVMTYYHSIVRVITYLILLLSIIIIYIYILYFILWLEL